MPLIKLTHEGQVIRRRRLLIAGGPNKRKTTAALTAPKPIGILSYPGEKGYDTIPTDNPDIIPLVWQNPEKLDSHQIVREITQASIDMIAGKYGKINTFVGDGLHKFYEYILDDVTDGSWFGGLEFEPKLYAMAHRVFIDYLSRTMHNPLPVVIFTTWDGSEPDRQPKAGEKARDIPSHTWPDLPGKMAKKIIGEFSVVVHSSLRSPKPGEPVEAYWQTRPSGEVEGCGVKGPAETVKKLPLYIKADYQEFERQWDLAAK